MARCNRDSIMRLPRIRCSCRSLMGNDFGGGAVERRLHDLGHQDAGLDVGSIGGRTQNRYKGFVK